VFECDREASIMSKPRPDRAVEQWQIRKSLYFNQKCANKYTIHQITNFV